MEEFLCEYNLNNEYDFLEESIKEDILISPENYYFTIDDTNDLHEYIVDSLNDYHMQMVWDDIIYTIDKVISSWNSYMVCEIHNFGWRKISGTEYLDIKNAEDLLDKILPKTENVFSIYLLDENKLKIYNKHHDSPWGDEYYIIYEASDELIASGYFN